MFCGKCGTQNPETAAFCKRCGMRLKDQAKPAVKPAAPKAPVEPQLQYQPKRPAPKRKRRRNDKNGIIAIAAMAALILVLALVLFSGRSYKATVKQFVNATFEADGKALVKLIPKDLMEYALDESGYDEDELDEMIEDLDDELQDAMDLIERYLGDNWKVSYKIIDTEDIKGDDLKDLKKSYKRLGVKISAAKDVEMELTLKTKEDKESNTVTISLIKVGRSWYLDLDSMGSLF